MPEKDDKKRALDLALAQIEKQYGKGAVMKLGHGRGPPMSRRFRPVLWDSTLLWESAGFLAAA